MGFGGFGTLLRSVQFLSVGRDAVIFLVLDARQPLDRLILGIELGVSHISPATRTIHALRPTRLTAITAAHKIVTLRMVYALPFLGCPLLRGGEDEGVDVINVGLYFVSPSLCRASSPTRFKIRT